MYTPLSSQMLEITKNVVNIDEVKKIRKFVLTHPLLNIIYGSIFNDSFNINKNEIVYSYNFTFGKYDNDHIKNLDVNNIEKLKTKIEEYVEGIKEITIEIGEDRIDMCLNLDF